MKWTSIVICLGIVIIGIYILLPKGNVIYKSENITVKSFDYSRENVPPFEISSVYLTEDEIFNNYNTVIFKGTVKDIENIKIDFDGDVVYRSIVTISVQEIYRGDLQTGDQIKILFSLPIDEEKYAMEGTFIGLFIGHCIYKTIHYYNNPDLYMIYSAPWYTSIQIGWSNLSAILVNRYVCCKCGYSEEWIDEKDISKLKKKYE